MKFCTLCNNVMYEIVEGSKAGEAIIKCRKCEYTEPVESLVYEHNLKNTQSSKYVVNPYLKNDPTLLHIHTLPCPNIDCKSKSGEKSDIVAIKIDAKKLIWQYQCVHCSAVWEQLSRAV